MTDKEFDEVIIRNINEVEIPFEIDVDEIISAAENKKKRKKVISIVACVMIILAVIFSIALINSEKEESNIEMNAHDKQEEIEDKVQVEENYGIINLDYKDNTALYIIPDIKETLKTYVNNVDYKGRSGIVIAKVEDIKYTNYDKDGEPSENYTFIRSIANVKVLKSIEGIFNEGDTIEIRAKGGIIDYDEYIKEFEQYNSSADSIDKLVYEQEYNKLVEEGKTRILVSEYRKLDTKLENGKIYMMFVFQRNWGDYWIETANTLLREYNQKDNTVLNNETGEYEELDLVLN